MNHTGRWTFWIDRGGTFTDVVALDPSGQLRLHKLLSEDPGRYRDAPLAAIRRLLDLGPRDRIRASQVAGIRMGTTVATNALLERRGSRVLWVTTRGFADALEIGTQARPELFQLHIRKPGTLPERVLEVDARRRIGGEVVARTDRDALRRALSHAKRDGIDAVAVTLLHSYDDPTDEREVGALAREVGFSHIALSHEVIGEIGLTGRGDTTTADAYLTPILRDYVERLRRWVDADVPLRFMQSSGGLTDAATFSGKDAVFSGPAGGVVACAHVARAEGWTRAIGFDMGGTSTDVCRVDTEAGFERVFERVIGGVRLKAPMLDVITIAAGGGSVLGFDGRRLTVGPESAGAHPGPVCYRRGGGTLAVTDANAVLGRVQPAYFPACFGPTGDAPLDVDAARARLDDLAAEVGRATGTRPTVEALAAGFIRVANAHMVEAIRQVSVARGYDVSDYALVCFGGAGAQHACALADALGIHAVLLHPFAGVLSAFGMGLADITWTDLRAWLRPLLDLDGLEAAYRALEDTGRAAVTAQGIPPDAITVTRSADLRYAGVDATLHVRCGPDGAPARADFEDQHRRLYGFDRPDHPVEVVNLRVEVVGRTPRPDWPQVPPGDVPAPVEHRPVWFPTEGGVRREDVPVIRRAELGAGAELRGPALVVEDVSTVVVDPGWSATLEPSGTLVLRRVEAPHAETSEDQGTRRDPVSLEIMGNLYMSIAEQMGLALQRVSLSVNIKERLDFSCAVFDPDAQLVANAPHIPVHLGAMSESVKAVVAARRGAIEPGDVYLTNDPYHGGSHLPDVTVITPVFLEGDRDAPTFFVASRGHHADVGGIVPGSMPPFSRTIDEEGVRLHDVLVVRGGRFLEAELRARLSAGAYPVRGVDERLADVQAQVAANAVGVRLLEELVAQQGRARVVAYMRHVQDDAAEAMEAALRALPEGERVFEDHLDDGSPVVARVKVADGRAWVDFAGTGPRPAGNLNAPEAVVKAAVLYVFRTLVGRAIPLNAGCLRPVELTIPQGSLLSPEPPDPVVGGNVETSQRVVDVLYGALGVLAASQGTMNNLTFGGEGFGYYETICGGAGAGLGFEGASAVQTHMTNTRITDPEVLERRFPVAVQRFAIRRGSGGEGVWRGGDGVVRALEFLAPLTAAVLSERRGVAPFGLHGGGAGARGRNTLRRADGQTRSLPAKVRVEVGVGDVLEVETPGGGGYCPSRREWADMSPEVFRGLVAEGRYEGPTAGICAGYEQANVVWVPEEGAEAFAAFVAANPQACPLLERVDGGSRSTIFAPGADLRRAIPRYRVFAGGEVREAREVEVEGGAWFLLGCSFSMEAALLEAGVPVRHIEEGRNVPMYRTNRRTSGEGPFAGGPLVVSVRPMTRAQAEVAERVTTPLARAHGAPLGAGDLAEWGIEDAGCPDFGEAVTWREGEVGVVWACGVTTQEAVARAIGAGAIDRAVTHAPGHMLIGSLRTEV